MFGSTGYGSTTIHDRAPRGLLPPLKYGVEGVLAVQTPPGGHSHTYPGYPQRKDGRIDTFSIHKNSCPSSTILRIICNHICAPKIRYSIVICHPAHNFFLRNEPFSSHRTPNELFFLMFTSSPQKSVQIAVPFRIKCS